MALRSDSDEPGASLIGLGNFQVSVDGQGVPPVAAGLDRIAFGFVGLSHSAVRTGLLDSYTQLN